jgi:hypothetical protein
MEGYCLFCIDYKNKRYMYYRATPELILKKHHKLVNNMVLLKYNEDEVDSVIVVLESIGYNWRGKAQAKKCWI